MTSKTFSFNSVDEYIATFPADIQKNWRNCGQPSKPLLLTQMKKSVTKCQHSPREAI